MSEPQKLKNRRSFEPEFKTKVILELLSGERTLAGASAYYNIKDSLLSKWKQDFLLRCQQVFEVSSETTSDEIEELKRIVGEQAIELSILKKAYGISTSRHGRSS